MQKTMHLWGICPYRNETLLALTARYPDGSIGVELVHAD